MLDKLRIDDLASEESRRGFTQKLNELMEHLDRRLSSIEKAMSPDEPEDAEIIDAGGIDVHSLQQGNAGVEIKVRKHSFLYELRWKYDDVIDNWKHIVQASNEFTILTERPASIIAEIRYMSTPFSKWSRWVEVNIDGPSDYNVDVDINTVKLSSPTTNALSLEWDWPTNLLLKQYAYAARLYVAKFSGSAEPDISEAILMAQVSYPERKISATGLEGGMVYRAWIRLLQKPIVGGLSSSDTEIDWAEIALLGPYDTTTQPQDWTISIDSPVVTGAVEVLDEFDVNDWSVISGTGYTISTDKTIYYSPPRSLRIQRNAGASIQLSLEKYIDVDSTDMPVAGIVVRGDGDRLEELFVRFYYNTTLRGYIVADKPVIANRWSVITRYLGEYTDINRVVIDITWKSGVLGYVNIDYLTISRYAVQPQVNISSPSFSVPLFPPDSLPVNLGLGRITGQGAYFSNAASQYWYVPNGKVWRVRSLITTQSSNTVTIGSANLNHVFSGVQNIKNADVLIGPGEYVRFQSGGSGNVRWVYDEYSLPANAIWFVDNVITQSIIFPPSGRENSYGWIIRYYLPTNLLRSSLYSNSTLPPGDDWRTSKWVNMWTFYGGDRIWLAAAGTGYLTGLMYILPEG